MVAKTGLVILAEGAEEMEAVISIDVMRRGKIDVTVAGLDGCDPVHCSRGVFVKPDADLENARKKGLFDIVVLPGGLGGADRLSKSALVKEVLTEHEKSGKFIAAICAGPTALVSHEVAKGKKVTSYPSLKDKFPGYDYQEERVVRDGNVITSRGPGTAMEFAVEIVRALQGDAAAKRLPEEMLMK